VRVVCKILGIVALAMDSLLMSAPAPPPSRYQGMSDASAVVTLGSEHFAVADDEDNVLRIYSLDSSGLPEHAVDFSSFLAVDPRSPEVDLEGAARIGDRIYWISSHGRNKRGEECLSRHRFFATTIVESNGVFDIKAIGQSYTNLLHDLLNDLGLARFNLPAAAKRAPKAKEGLNIEGLCATPEGHLLVGFRNPIPDGMALIVPLLNPADLIIGKQARFGKPLLLDLGGLGIRSIAMSKDRYLIAAGSYDGTGQVVLYEWEGGPVVPRRLQRNEIVGLNAEAVEFFDEGTKELLVASDDGALKGPSKQPKWLRTRRQKSFRAMTLDF
jgi:hypothetical protein